MKFAKFNPLLSGTATPDLWKVRHGVSGVMQLSFDCPACGPDYRCMIYVRLNQPPHADFPIWGLSVEYRPGAESFAGATITPSINYTTAGHGRKRACSWHGSVVNGEVV